VDVLFLDDLLKLLLLNTQDIEEFSSVNVAGSKYRIESLGKTLFDFVKMELSKVDKHRESFSIKKVRIHKKR